MFDDFLENHWWLTRPIILFLHIEIVNKIIILVISLLKDIILKVSFVTICLNLTFLNV